MAYTSGEDGDAVTEMSFLQVSPVPGTDGVTHGSIKCYACQKMGHYAGQCPREAEAEEGVQLLNVELEESYEEEYVSEFVFLQKQDTRLSHIPSTWVLLDSCSTVSVFKTRKYVTNIRKGDRILKALTNGGHQSSTDIADTQNFGHVWFNEDSLANILSLAEVSKHARVTMDTDIKNCMYVHRKDGIIMEFKELNSGFITSMLRNKEGKLTVIVNSVMSTLPLLLHFRWYKL